ncbi:hypothetical protein AQI84_34580 [Streptomyces griseorubiginosus]|nr:hypothetical protein AQI84_34580 [Streptomyces griseorubiginosus]
MFADAMSDRTFATYYKAFRVPRNLYGLGIITEDEVSAMHTAARAAATRPNASFNTSAYARAMDEQAAWYIDERCPEDGGESDD